MPDETYKVQHWRLLAARATAAANQTTDLNDRMNMLRIAVGYEQLAREAEQRQTETRADSSTLFDHDKDEHAFNKPG